MTYDGRQVMAKAHLAFGQVSKKREKTQIKGWIELSSLVNRTGSTLSTSVLSFKLIAWIVIEKF